MAGPASAPSLEVLQLQAQIAELREEVSRLQTIIAIYIAPNYDIFSEDEETKSALREAVKRKRDILQDSPIAIRDIEDRVDACERKLNQRKNKQHEARLKRTDEILVRNGNTPVTFSDMGKLQQFSPKTRRQNMTHLGNAYSQFPDRYEVRESKLQGKTVRLVPAYLKHLTEGGV